MTLAVFIGSWHEPNLVAIRDLLRVAPEHERIRFVVLGSGGLAMAGATALSGWLYAGFGLRAYGAMALMAVAGGACAVVTSRIGAVAVR